MTTDNINPLHYRNSSGKQLIDIIRYMPFSIGNCMKYCFRNENKNNPIEDLKKSLWYLNDYRNNLVVLQNVDPLPDEYFYEIFENITEWETNVCRKIFILFNEINKTATKNVADPNIDKLFSEIEEMINQKILKLSNSY